MKRIAKFKPLTPDLRAKIERLLVLHKAHRDAIRTGSAKFYDDGRHQELVDLLPEVHRALGIRPWDDSRERLREALRAG